MTTFIAGIAVMLVASGSVLSSARAQQIPTITGEQSVAPKCAIAESATYAFTKEDPVKVGGGATTVAARERRYLDALRGPAGQVIRYQRRGSGQGPDKTILDFYEVTYDGLEKPIVLHIDAYRWASPKAPQGFVCAAAFGLAPPPPDPLRIGEHLVTIALEFGVTRDLPPVPLGPGGSTTHGVVFDRFRRIVQAAQSAAASGKPLDPASPPLNLSSLSSVVVAYPVTCDGRAIAPEEIDVLNAQGRAAPRSGGYSRGDDLTTLLSGAALPAGAVGAAFPISTIATGQVVRITYADTPCGSTGKSVSLSATVTPARRTEAPLPSVPPGTPVPAAPVRVQVFIAPDGTVHFPAYLDGPEELADLAAAAVREWRYEPMRSNGEVVVLPINVSVGFTDGRPRPPGAGMTPPLGASPGSRTIEVIGPPRVASSPPDFRALDAPLAQLAIEYPAGAAIAGIPLDADGSRTHGVAFDRFRLGVLAARAAAAAGTPIDPSAPPDGFLPMGVAVVAFPLTCDGKSNPPTSIELLDSRGLPMRLNGPTRDKTALADLLPGVTLPTGAIGGLFGRGQFGNGDAVRITYAAPACPGEAREVTLPMTTTLPRPTRQVHPTSSPGAISGAVGVRVVIDVDGVPKYARASDGPEALKPEAERTAAEWRWTPATINGAPVPHTIGYTIRFGPPAGPGTSPMGMTGAPAGAGMRSSDAPGLTSATSRCPIAADPAYGARPDQSVKVGGGAANGEARARGYLMALRGPAGQGLTISKLPAPPTPVTWEAYFIAYPGIGSPLVLYVDTSATGELFAPAGFTCATTIK